MEAMPHNVSAAPDAEGTVKPEVLVIEDDLFFSVRIESVLKKLGYVVHVIGDREKALAQAASRMPALIIINFGSDRLTPAETVRKIKALPAPAPVLGFVSHKWIPQVRPNAMGAGCDLLVANSALTMRLPQLVARLVPLDGTVSSVSDAAVLAADHEKEE